MSYIVLVQLTEPFSFQCQGWSGVREDHACHRPWLSECISIPLFSPWNVTFFQLAPVGISVPAFDSRSDLRYVPTLRTYLHHERSYSINVFFIRRVGNRGPGLTCCKKKSDFNSGDFSLESRGFFSGIAWIFPLDCVDFFPRLRGFPPAIAGISPAIARIFPAIFPGN